MKKISTSAKKIQINHNIILMIFIVVSSIILTTTISYSSSNNEIITQYNLYINEFMADNDATIPGQEGNYPDWIELYNNGSEPLNISGMYLTDDLTSPTKWQFPNNTVIDSGGYLLIWGDGYNTSKEGMYASFELNANGETVALFASDGETLIDSVNFRKQIRDTSYGRLPDGGNDWEYLSDPSPGYSNGERPSNEQIPNWLLPVLIVLVIVILIAIISIRKILIGRDFK